MKMLSKIDNYMVGIFNKREKIDINQYITKYETIWAIIFFLNIEDAFVSLVAVRNLGINEINPIMNNILLSSPPGFVIVKMIMVCILFLFVYNYLSCFDKIHKATCWYMIIFFALVNINNLVHVMLRYMVTFSG